MKHKQMLEEIKAVIRYHLAKFIDHCQTMVCMIIILI
jgi:hypothetical protein